MGRGRGVWPCSGSHSVAGLWCSVSGSAGIRRSALGASPPSFQPADCEESCGPPPRPVYRCIPILKGSQCFHPIRSTLSLSCPPAPLLGPPRYSSCCRMCGANEPGQSNSHSLHLPLRLLSTPPFAETKCFLCHWRSVKLATDSTAGTGSYCSK